MTKKNKAAPQSGTTSNNDVHHNMPVNSYHSIPEPRGVTRIMAAIHLLSCPAGVTEHSINVAAKCMSGRNYPTDFEREQGITLIKARLRNTHSGKRYTRYQIADHASAAKLAKYILHLQGRYSFQAAIADELMKMAACYPVVPTKHPTPPASLTPSSPAPLK